MGKVPVASDNKGRKGKLSVRQLGILKGVIDARLDAFIDETAS